MLPARSQQFQRAASRTNSVLRQRGFLKTGGALRQFSSIPSLTQATLRRPLLAQTTAGCPRITSLLPLWSVRFNSTTPSSTPASTVTSSPTTPSFEPFDTPLDIDSLTEVTKVIPENIGFLHELGLNYGWGPTSCMQWLLEHIHVYTGAPWWASVIGLTVLIRIVLLPGYIKMSDAAARMREVQPFAAPVMAKLQQAQREKDTVKMQLAQLELKHIYDTAQVTKSWLLFPIAQMPVFYGVYNLLWKMAQIPVPGLTDGGIFWFHDLSSTDPFLILPIMTSGTIALSIFLGGEGGSSTVSPGVKKVLMFILPGISFFFFWRWPAILTMYFATSSILGLIQALLLRNAKFRELVGIYPLPPPAKPEHSKSGMNIIDARFEAVKADEAKPNDESTSGLAERVKKMMGTGTGDINPITTGIRNATEKFTGNQKDSKYVAYERRRAREEMEKKRATYEQKKVKL